MALKATDRQAARDWDAYYESFIADVYADQYETLEEQKARIKRLESNFEEWKKYYFHKYCSAPPAPFHVESSKYALEHPESIIARIWAREMAKDVVTMIETIYQDLTGVKKCILLISNSYEKAEDLITPYRLNLEKNERLIRDYGVQQLIGSWTAGGFITTRGTAYYAIGAGQSPRGLKNEEIRPDKLIFTDVDTDEDVRNGNIIDKRWKWSESAAYGTRSVSKDFQIVWLGNKIAKDCCIVRAAEKADRVEVVNLIDENGESTWKEKNTPDRVERIKNMFSTAVFQAEYMNNPLSEGDVFKELTYGEVPPLEQFQFIVNYGDPSPSNNKSKKASYKSLWSIGFLNGKYYIIKGFVDHVTNAEFVEWYYHLKDYIGDKTQIYNYIENNTLQDPFYQQVFLPLFAERAQTRGFIGIIPDERKKPDKFSRVEGNLEPLNRLGCLILNIAEKDNPHMKRLAEQFLLINPLMKAPADAPDCIEGGVWKINEKLSQFEVANFQSFSKGTNNKRI